MVSKPCTQYLATGERKEWICSMEKNLCLDECQMTVMGRIILRFFYKVWFFGAIYFCLSWLFLLVRSERTIFSSINRSILLAFSDLSSEFIDQSLSSSRIEHSRIYRGNILRRSRWRWSIDSINEQQNFSKLRIYFLKLILFLSHLDWFLSVIDVVICI